MKFVPVILLVIGVALVGLGGYMYVSEAQLLQSDEHALATVTDNVSYEYTGEVNKYGVQHYYCSVFDFQTSGGRSLEIEEGGADCAHLDQPPNFQVGEKVDLYYEPADPLNTVQTPKRVKLSYNGAIIVAVTGALCFMFGLGLLLAGWLRSNRTARK